MGVRGLTTYINQNSHRYLKSHELHDCNLIIDGNNLACQIYKFYGPHNSAYGGDYDKYSESVTTFFQALKQCNVTAYVIMDGGYEVRKLRTVHRRLSQKITVVAKCTPSPQNNIQVFPILMKHAFKDVLRKLTIPCAQCDFEADDEIAAVARKLGCPVLSYDSDFYICNVPYIPFSTCEVDVKKKKGEGGQDVYFIKCKIYHVEGLVKHFGGLDSSLLPLMAVLLGNDYVKGSLFKNFFLHVKLPQTKKMSQQQKKIAEVIEWLKKETVESALIKILSKFKKGRRAYLSRVFESSIKRYTEEFSTTLKYLGLSGDSDSNNQPVVIPVIKLSDEEIEESAKTLDEDVCDDDKSENSQSENSLSENSLCEDEELNVQTCDPSKQTGRVFPPWLMASFRSGLVDSCVANIFYLCRCYFDPQVEDFTLSPTYELSLPILKVSFGLLVKSDQVLNEDEEYALRCFGRNNRGKVQRFYLNPVMRTNSVDEFCNLSSLNGWPLTKRESVLFDIMTLTQEKDIKLLKTFPEEWRLYALAIVYWGRQNKEWPHVTNCHIHALVLCIISLSVVDLKAGYYRNTSAFQRKHGSYLRKSRTEFKASNAALKQTVDNSQPCREDSVESIVECLLKNVSFDECLCLEDKMIEYHQGKSCPYSLTAVHSFGQLQSCLNQAITLNALLGFPVPHCSIANFYSGRFVTSVYGDLSKRSNLEVYLDLIMKSSPSIRNLHSAIVEIFFKLIPHLVQLVRKGKNKRKRKALKRRVRVEGEGSDNEGSDEAIDSHDMPVSCLENRFSLLSVQ